MAHEVHRSRPRRSTFGYAVVVLGAALFVVSCFLPYQRFSVIPAASTTSLYQQVTFVPGGGGSDPGALLFLFGGVVPLAVVALIALVRGERGPVLPSVLMGALLAWSLTWIGTLLRLGSFGDDSLEIGFWLQAASIGVAVIGTILVGFGKRSEVKDSHDRYTNEERLDPGA
jgi:hypothetical protein